MKTARKVTLGNRCIKEIEKIAKCLNITKYEMYDKIISEWLVDHDDNYSISIPDTFIIRSISISDANWSVISDLAKKRSKPGTRFFAIILDEWLSKNKAGKK